MENLKIRHKLLILVVVMLLSFAAIAAGGIFVLNNVKIGGGHYWTLTNYRNILRDIALLKGDLNEVDAMEAYLLIETDKTLQIKMAQEIRELVNAINQEFQATLNLVSEEDADLKISMRSARFTWDEYAKTLEEPFFPRILEGRIKEAREITVGIQRQREKRFIEQVDSAANTLSLQVERHEKESLDIANFSILLLLISFVSVSVGMLFLTVSVSRRISIPLSYLASLEEKAGLGDLSLRADLKGSDELSMLAQSFNKMASELEEERSSLVEKVKERTIELEREKASLERKVLERTRELEDARQNLEEIVKDRTCKLQERVNELEEFHRLTVDRELKMVELEQEINALLAELNRPKKYGS